MKKDTILFDLDGTLLPMDQNAFMEAYFTRLCAKCAQHGFDDAKAVTAAVWAGTKAMVKNDGGANNEERFWQTFAQALGKEVLALRPVLELFYENEFCAVQSATRENPLAAGVVRSLRGKGYTLALATNPLFPRNAVRTRLGWVGLAPEDFDWVTSYENSHFCKPNTRYYDEILRQLGRQPQQCLMVGNDVGEDGCAAALGMEVFLVTDDLLNPDGLPLEPHRTGSFAQCAAFLQALPGIGPT